MALPRVRGLDSALRARVRRGGRARLDRQERLPDRRRARQLSPAGRDPDGPRPAGRRSGRRELRILHALSRRVPDRGVPRAGAARRGPLPRLLDHRASRPDSRPVEGGGRPARLRLRRLPGGLPLERAPPLAAVASGNGTRFAEAAADARRDPRDGKGRLAPPLRQDRRQPRGSPGPAAQRRGLGGRDATTRPAARSSSAPRVSRRPASPRPRAGRSAGSRLPCKIRSRFERTPSWTLRRPSTSSAFVLSLAASAFFGGSETALFSLGRIDLQAMREKGDRRGALIRSHAFADLAAARRPPDRPEPLHERGLRDGHSPGGGLVRPALRKHRGAHRGGPVFDADPLHLRRDDAQGRRRGLARGRRPRGRRSRSPG